MKMTRRAMRKVRRVKRQSMVTSINLVSMIDMFTILIIYLLVNTAAVQVIGAEQVDLPKSLSLEPPRETVAVIISATDILVDGEAVMKVEDAKASAGVVLEALKARLLAESPPTAVQQQAAAEGKAVEGGEVNIMADKNIPYSLLKRVMATCTSAQFEKISLGVIPRSGGGAVP
jgi:biopolymer transport protein ExbD